MKDFAEVMETAGLSYAPIAARRDVGMITDAREELGPIKTRCMAQTDGLRRLREHIVDLAIVGFDTLNEFNCAARDTRFISEALNVSACAMWIAAREENPIKQWSDLSGKRIATSYPATLKDMLEKKGITDFEIVEFDGGVEEAIDMGLADAICDLVDTGNTLKANGLVPYLEVYRSTAMLVRRADDGDRPETTAVSRRLMDAADRIAVLKNPELRFAA